MAQQLQFAGSINPKTMQNLQHYRYEITKLKQQNLLQAQSYQKKIETLEKMLKSSGNAGYPKNGGGFSYGIGPGYEGMIGEGAGGVNGEIVKRDKEINRLSQENQRLRKQVYMNPDHLLLAKKRAHFEQSADKDAQIIRLRKTIHQLQSKYDGRYLGDARIRNEYTILQKQNEYLKQQLQIAQNAANTQNQQNIINDQLLQGLRYKKQRDLLARENQYLKSEYRKLGEQYGSYRNRYGGVGLGLAGQANEIEVLRREMGELRKRNFQLDSLLTHFQGNQDPNRQTQLANISNPQSFNNSNRNSNLMSKEMHMMNAMNNNPNSQVQPHDFNNQMMQNNQEQPIYQTQRKPHSIFGKINHIMQMRRQKKLIGSQSPQPQSQAQQPMPHQGYAPQNMPLQSGNQYPSQNQSSLMPPPQNNYPVQNQLPSQSREVSPIDNIVLNAPGSGLLPAERSYIHSRQQNYKDLRDTQDMQYNKFLRNYGSPQTNNYGPTPQTSNIQDPRYNQAMSNPNSIVQKLALSESRNNINSTVPRAQNMMGSNLQQNYNMNTINQNQYPPNPNQPPMQNNTNPALNRNLISNYDSMDSNQTINSSIRSSVIRNSIPDQHMMQNQPQQLPPPQPLRQIAQQPPQQPLQPPQQPPQQPLQQPIQQVPPQQLAHQSSLQSSQQSSLQSSQQFAPQPPLQQPPPQQPPQAPLQQSPQQPFILPQDQNQGPMIISNQYSLNNSGSLNMNPNANMNPNMNMNNSINSNIPQPNVPGQNRPFRKYDSLSSYQIINMKDFKVL